MNSCPTGTTGDAEPSHQPDDHLGGGEAGRVATRPSADAIPSPVVAP